MENQRIANRAVGTKVRKLVLCGLFTALIAVGAWIKIPVPVVPFTLQFLFTTLAGLLLGGRLGALSVGVYILLGLIGLPVFAEGGGPWYLFQPSFGYLLGFCLGSYVTGKLVETKRCLTLRRLLAANFAGLALVYVVGMLYYAMICKFVLAAPIGFGALVWYCFVLAVPGDILLCILAAFLAKRVKPITDSMR